jgi:hypothetical protein
MSRLIFSCFGTLHSNSPSSVVSPAASRYLPRIIEVSSRTSRCPQTGNAGWVEVDAA